MIGLHRRSFRHLIAIAIAYVISASPLVAQELSTRHLPMDGKIAQNGTAVQLDWFATSQPRVGSVSVERRILGDTGPQTWRRLTPPKAALMTYLDSTTQMGVAYEYRVTRELRRDVLDVGYWATGRAVLAPETSGHAYLVVDATLAQDLQPRLARYQRDLVGDGWRTTQINVPRHDEADAVANLKNLAVIKGWLKERFDEDPDGSHAILLIGHVPVISSGSANPDGHAMAPHATDLIYADVDAGWRLGPQGAFLDNRLPSDFIEMHIGRVDFANVARGLPEQELHLLRAYFDKAHHWRMGFHGDLREAYGQSKLLAGEIYGLRNVLGPKAVTTGGHHDVGEEKPWLWGVDFGDWNGQNYAPNYANKAIFTLNFGSGKQQFAANENAMTALLAQPWYPVAVGWGARPAWWPHLMALGDTIGQVHMRTVNNGRASQPYPDSMDYYPTGRYLWRNPVWVNLLGDPTLRAFVMKPPSQPQAIRSDNGIVLSWRASPDPDVLGYSISRATPDAKSFVTLTDGELVKDTTFVDTAPVNGARYLIRAYGLKTVYAGSFYTYSQAAFAQLGQSALIANDLQINANKGQTIVLPIQFNSSENGVIYAFIAGPTVGDLMFEGGNWRFSPPPDFTGTIALPFTVSDALHTEAAVLSLTIGG